MHPGTTRGPRRFRPIHPLIGPALFLLDETTRRLTVKGAATGEPQLTAADPPTPGAGLYVPLKRAGGRLLGVLQVHRATPPRPFTPRDLAQGPAVAPQVAVALENAQRYQRTTELRAKDELTGLANRRAFFEALEAEDQRARRSRLGSTRRADVVARCGGEEFVVLLPESLKAAGAQHPTPGREQQPGGRLTVTCGVAASPGTPPAGSRWWTPPTGRSTAASSRGATGWWWRRRGSNGGDRHAARPHSFLCP